MEQTEKEDNKVQMENMQTSEQNDGWMSGHRLSEAVVLDEESQMKTVETNEHEEWV